MRQTIAQLAMKSQAPSFLKTFQLKYPIIQSPMAGASTVELAATISSLNGLGSIPIGENVENTQLIGSLFRKFQSLVGDESLKTNVIINFFAHDVPLLGTKEQSWIQKYKGYYESKQLKWREVKVDKVYQTFKTIDDETHETLKLLAELKPKVISFHFGLPPLKTIEFLQKSGIKVFVSVTNLQEFEIALSSSLDGVVLQGWEAGGHRGNFKANDTEDEQLSTEDLVKTIVHYIDSKGITDAPFLIAAGGIYDTEGINSLLKYGIAAVQLGTVWLPTSQATISSRHLALIKNPEGTDTLVTAAISGRNLRTIRSRFLEHLASSPLDSIPDYPVPYSFFKNLNADANAQNFNEFLPFLAGSNYHKSWKGTDDPKEVFKQLVDGLKY